MFASMGHLRWVFALGMALILFPGSATDSPPNVLFIVADDMNTDLGCYGNTLIESPNLDRLSERGIRFDRAYCQYPLCGPSRTSVLTGLRPDTSQIWQNLKHFRSTVPAAVTLPQLFRQNGYFVARAGKIFHYGVPGDIGTNGWDDAASWDSVKNPLGRDKEEEERIVNLTPERPLGSSLSFLSADGSDEEQTDGMVATEVIRFLESNQQPFFIAAGFFRPHCPYVAPNQDFRRYPLRSISLPATPQGYRDSVPEAAFWTDPPNWGVPENELKQATQAYYASISFVDRQVGRVLAALDRLGLRENTIIVFWSDHGYQLGHHDGQWMKQSLFEQALRVPLIISTPEMNMAGNTVTAPVELLDLYPTLAELCHLTPPASIEGTSLAPLLVDPQGPWSKPAVSQVHRRGLRGYSIRDQRWRYTEWDRGRAGQELYDHLSDPEELNNLAQQENEYRKIIEELKDRLYQIIDTDPDE